jgi:hypothetical protein
MGSIFFSGGFGAVHILILNFFTPFSYEKTIEQPLDKENNITGRNLEGLYSYMLLLRSF